MTGEESKPNAHEATKSAKEESVDQRAKRLVAEGKQARAEGNMLRVAEINQKISTDPELKKYIETTAAALERTEQDPTKEASKSMENIFTMAYLLLNRSNESFPRFRTKMNGKDVYLEISSFSKGTKQGEIRVNQRTRIKVLDPNNGHVLHELEVQKVGSFAPDSKKEWRAAYVDHHYSEGEFTDEDGKTQPIEDDNYRWRAPSDIDQHDFSAAAVAEELPEVKMIEDMMKEIKSRTQDNLNESVVPRRKQKTIQGNFDNQERSEAKAA